MVPDRLISEAVGAILTEQVFKGNRHRYVCESYMPMKSCATSTRVEYFTRRRREGMNRGQDRAEITLKVSNKFLICWRTIDTNIFEFNRIEIIIAREEKLGNFEKLFD